MDHSLDRSRLTNVGLTELHNFVRLRKHEFDAKPPRNSSIRRAGSEGWYCPPDVEIGEGALLALSR